MMCRDLIGLAEQKRNFSLLSMFLGLFLRALSMDCPCSSQHGHIFTVHCSGLECLHNYSIDTYHYANAFLFGKDLFIHEVSYHLVTFNYT